MNTGRLGNVGSALAALGQRAEAAPRPVSWIRTAAFWTATAIIAWEMLAGSMWDLFQVEYVRVVFSHLHYPLFLLIILGAWKLPCAVVLLIPRFPRLKEWAYAGAFFNYSGAFASHALVGDRSLWLAGTLGFAAITMISWALRPADRRLGSYDPGPPPRPIAWILPIAAAAVLIVIDILTLPQSPPPIPF
jgi:DoxX-like protein